MYYPKYRQNIFYSTTRKIPHTYIYTIIYDYRYVAAAAECDHAAVANDDEANQVLGTTAAAS